LTNVDIEITPYAYVIDWLAVVYIACEALHI